MEDIEIARATKLEDIRNIAKKLDIGEEDLELYGKYKAKISKEVYENLKEKPNGKMILVTAISPTSLGEGKTTVSIAIADALSKLNKKAVLALREPSLGPVFGIKGGATGGGRVQVAPMEDINLHFTGDIHAITSANNLLSAMIDNHIFFGNKLELERVIWKRCVDLNDRQLRKVETGLSNEKNTKPRMDGFDISVASEVMAILCLASDLTDLKKRLGNILIGYNKNNEPVYAKSLKAEGAMTALLKDAFNPNLVQTLEKTPAIIHGGPFANIAHGCNSISATKLALKVADYVVTEAGFGADLGAEKFLDIKCRKANLKPNAVALVATIKALKYHGGVEKENILEPNIKGIEKGLSNLYHHYNNLNKKYGLPVVVALNRYTSDTEEEINYLKETLSKKGIKMEVVEGWAKGGEGAIDMAKALIQKMEEETSNFKYIYETNEDIKTKIEKVSKEIYGAKGVEYSKEALEEIEKIEKLGYSNFPVCIAKTQYSLSDDMNNLEAEGDYNIHIKEIILKTGAEFVVAIAGNILTMPGLPKVPAAENVDVNDKGEIQGIF